MIIIDPSNPTIHMDITNPTWKLGSLQKGLVAHWPLDEQSFNPATKRFTDQSAYCNHGTGVGAQLGSVDPGFQVDRMGQLVRAAPFNGSDDYIDCGNDSSLNITDAITIATWINPEEQLSNYKTIIGKVKTLNLELYEIRTYISTSETTILQFRIGNTAVGSCSLSIDNNIYSHIVGTFDGSDIIFYKNGALIDSETFVSTIASMPNIYLNIGKLVGQSNYFKGYICSTSIYNRALSQQEITLLYESYRV